MILHSYYLKTPFIYFCLFDNFFLKFIWYLLFLFMQCFKFMLCFFLLLLCQLCVASVSFKFLSATPLAILSLPASRKAQADGSIGNAFDSLSSSPLMLFLRPSIFFKSSSFLLLASLSCCFSSEDFLFCESSFFPLLHVPSMPCENSSLILACPCSQLHY